MDLTAKPYRAFVRVAELSSFSRAAEELHMSQPALSALLREFERQLGFALFHRSSRRVELSQQGAMFLDRARRLILETELAKQAAAHIYANRLRIGVVHHTAAIGLRTELTDSFLVARPDIPVAILARHPRQLAENLAKGVIDVAVTLEMTDPLYESVVEYPAQMERIVLDTRPVTIAYPANHKLPEDQLTSVTLSGQRIATISRAHGVAIAESVEHSLAKMGAQILRPPEGDAQSVLRYAAQMSIPAIDLGWWPGPPQLISCPVAWSLATTLVVLSSSTGNHPARTAFLDHAQKLLEGRTQ